jgi:hypothetical protein
MIEQTDMQEIWKFIREKADKKAFFDKEYTCILDACGCNMDDAYELGVKDGEIGFAREIFSLIERKINGHKDT